MEFEREEGMSVETGQLARLSELDYEMEEGQPDIVGWKVVGENNDEIAQVSDLLVDLDTGAIMLAELSYDDKQTLIPVEAFALDTANSRLILPVDKQELEGAPLFTEETEDVSVFFDYWGSELEEEGDTLT
jgi:hypothetical protein